MINLKIDKAVTIVDSQIIERLKGKAAESSTGSYIPSSYFTWLRWFRKESGNVGVDTDGLKIFEGCLVTLGINSVVAAVMPSYNPFCGRANGLTSMISFDFAAVIDHLLDGYYKKIQNDPKQKMKENKKTLKLKNGKWDQWPLSAVELDKFYESVKDEHLDYQKNNNKKSKLASMWSKSLQTDGIKKSNHVGDTSFDAKMMKHLKYKPLKNVDYNIIYQFKLLYIAFRDLGQKAAQRANNSGLKYTVSSVKDYPLEYASSDENTRRNSRQLPEVRIVGQKIDDMCAHLARTVEAFEATCLQGRYDILTLDASGKHMIQFADFNALWDAVKGRLRPLCAVKSNVNPLYWPSPYIEIPGLSHEEAVAVRVCFRQWAHGRGTTPDSTIHLGRQLNQYNGGKKFDDPADAFLLLQQYESQFLYNESRVLTRTGSTGTPPPSTKRSVVGSAVANTTI